jgi:UDP-2-acetamido-2,6-beta-L-arabino-hexul-4-ose reductase
VKVLITGADGFIGRNLVAHLRERKDIEVLRFSRENDISELSELIQKSDFIYHLAGVNRPLKPECFKTGNVDLTQALCEAIKQSGNYVPLLYTSSVQAEQDNPYGSSKLGAEALLTYLSKEHGVPVYVFRLPNVFGKWARPNYNSAVATFCHNIARDLPIHINDPAAQITLIYIDDVIKNFIALMDRPASGIQFLDVEPKYQTTVGDVASFLKKFKDSRDNLVTESVGEGLCRALYSTYLSYLPPEKFLYEIPQYKDPRGIFVEMLKTKYSGQFSFFTAHPGITRGGHYHHSKTEKFLVIKGQALFRFKHIDSGEIYEVSASGEKSVVVETVPGWSHDITNIGEDEMIVMLWANEIFDRENPDTYSLPLTIEVNAS